MGYPEHLRPELMKLDQLKTLKEARRPVLELSGIEHYVPDFKASSQEIDAGLERMVEEVTNQLDAENMIPFIAHCLAFSDEETKSFFSHPERQPFQSQIEFSQDFETRLHEFLTIGKYLRLKYFDLRNKDHASEETKHAAENLRMFNEYSTYHLFQPMDFEFSDKIIGLNPEDRCSGNPKPDDEILEVIKSSANQSAEEFSVDAKNLYQRVLDVTEGGNYDALRSFLLNHTGDQVLRRALELTMEERTNDQGLAVKQLQILWIIETYRLSMGIDLELFYEINNLPTGTEIEERLHHFLQREDLTEEFWKHLEQEATSVTKKAQETGGSIDYWEMLYARAQYQNYPSQPRTNQELEAQRDRVWSKLAELIPLAFVESPTSLIYAPMRMGATRRAYNNTYPNTQDRQVNIFIVYPRDEELLFSKCTGHEAGHKLHATILKSAEDAGFIAPKRWERLSDPIKEEFSQLVKDQVGKFVRAEKEIPDVSADERQELKFQGEWLSLWDAYLIRRQAPYALTQHSIRIMMESLWNQGRRDSTLNPEDATQIIQEVNPKIRQWYSEGVPISVPIANTQTDINLLDPLDGLKYLKKFITKKKGKEEQEVTVDLKVAFEQRFGTIWIDNQEARAVLFALMAETGKNPNITTYPEFVRKANPQEALEKLHSWGIDPTLI